MDILWGLANWYLSQL